MKCVMLGLYLSVIIFIAVYFFSFFFFKQKTAYEMRISDWSSDGCSSDLGADQRGEIEADIETPDHLRRAAEARAEIVRFGHDQPARQHRPEIGRASCRERVCQYV